MSKIRWFLSIFMVYISIAGLVTFANFILEESFQTIMFGTWPASDAKRWDIVKEGINLMHKNIITGKVLNYSIGWVQPLAFISYHSYFKSAQFYMKSLNAKCLANAPELYVGETVVLNSFMAKSVKSNGSGYVTNIGKINVVFNTMPELNKSMEIKGKLELVDGRLVIFYEK